MRRFLMVFVVLQLVLFIVVEHVQVQQFIVAPWTAGVVQVCSALVTYFDQQATALGNVLWNPAQGVGVSIQAGCNGVEAFLTLLAAILAFPSNWGARLWGLAAGFLAVQGLNVVRVISLFYLLQWNRAAFDFAHTYVWQGLIMLDVLVFWLFWVRVSRPTASAVAPLSA